MRFLEEDEGSGRGVIDCREDRVPFMEGMAGKSGYSTKMRSECESRVKDNIEELNR